MARKKKQEEVKKIVRRKLTGKFSRMENGKRVTYGPGSLVEFSPYDDLPEAFRDDSWELVSGKELSLEILADVCEPLEKEKPAEEETSEEEDEEEDKYENLIMVHKGAGAYDVMNVMTEKVLNTKPLSKKEAEALLDTYLEDDA
jgi:hypothetical protein